MKRNILFLMADQFRGDCLGYAGHPDVKTPYLNTIAAEGQYFDNAYSSCPSCIAARATLMTGLSPEHTGRVGYRRCGLELSCHPGRRTDESSL